MADSTQQLEIVEVAPRDGFQSVGPMIPTLTKITVIEQLYAAGIRRMETTSFVSDRALPQMSDAADIVRSEEHPSELQSLMRISYAVFCFPKKTHNQHTTRTQIHFSIIDNNT